MILEKLNNNLLILKRKSTSQQFNLTFKHLFFPQYKHPYLFLGDDLPETFKRFAKANKEDQCLSKKNYFESNHSNTINKFNTPGQETEKEISNQIIETANAVNHISSKSDAEGCSYT